MELTGKCKEEFEKWLLDNFQKYGVTPLDCQTHLGEEIDFICHYSIYVDFFDSVGSYISVSGLVLSKTYICDISVISNVEHYYDGFSTRQEARASAIEKANEIYNLNQ
jgi:hypothetical protein